jgi:hypothetical protein
MYEIVSPRVGTPGAPFEPRPGVNVEALLAAGFIKESTRKPAKSGKKTEDISETGEQD